MFVHVQASIPACAATNQTQLWQKIDRPKTQGASQSLSAIERQLCQFGSATGFGKDGIDTATKTIALARVIQLRWATTPQAGYVRASTQSQRRSILRQTDGSEIDIEIVAVASQYGMRLTSPISHQAGQLERIRPIGHHGHQPARAQIEKFRDFAR